ncbi:MAG: hypothetical protein ACR2F1_07940 [Nitrososphaeraceae archaeon]
MTRKKPDKYLHENQIWYPIDIFNTCKKIVVKCNKGYLGHVSENLNQNKRKVQFNEKTQKHELFLQVDYFVHHSHFIADIDRGRHVRCKIGSDFVPESDDSITTMYRLNTKRILPEWVKEDLGYN